MLSFILADLYILQILGAIAYLIGTLLLAYSIEPYNPDYGKSHYMPMKINQNKFRWGIGCNFIGFLFLVGSLTIEKFLN
jgi:hypothetical protein